MADSEHPKKTAARKATAKAEATAPARKPAAKPAAKPVAKAKAKTAPSGPTVTVTRTGSDLGRPKWAKQTLYGLGLTKTNRTRVLEDTPSVRGMIRRVQHLVRVEEDTSKTGT